MEFIRKQRVGPRNKGAVKEITVKSKKYIANRNDVKSINKTTRLSKNEYNRILLVTDCTRYSDAIRKMLEMAEKWRTHGES